MSSDNEKKGPETKSQVGRFQVSLWRRTKVIPARDDYETERSFEDVRALVQHSRFNRGTDVWDTQRVWCHPDELRDLIEALTKLSEILIDGLASKSAQSAPMQPTKPQMAGQWSPRPVAIASQPGTPGPMPRVMPENAGYRPAYR